MNVAARMEQTAPPGTVQVSSETYRLVAPLFDFKSVEGVEIKGKSTPVTTYLALAAKEQPGPRRGLEGVRSPLIGRDTEFGQLKAVVEKLRQGRGQIVCLIGEAGLGKTRLLEELREEWIGDNDPQSWTLAQGTAYDSSRPYGLFQASARAMFGIEMDDGPELIHEKVDGAFRGRGVPDEAIELCNVAMERIIAAKVLHDAPDFSADELREDIYLITYQAWREEAAVMPVVMVNDDLHWADQASVDLLIHLFELTEEVPILFVCAFRPERQSPAWRLKLTAETDYPHRYTEIVLQPLESEAADALVSALLQIADLPVEFRRLILNKTEGNPYFVEEVVRSLIDDGVLQHSDDGLHWTVGRGIEDIVLPNSLQGLLTARIDRLDREVRATLQLAAVIGRSFSYGVLSAISVSAAAIDRHLSALQRAELVREKARVPDLEYTFRHELTRDAAYDTILLRKRRELHGHVGEAIEKLFPDRLEENAHRLAYHFAEAGDHERSLDYYVMAGDSAAKIGASTEAIDHYEHAINTAKRAGIGDARLSALQKRQADVRQPA